LILRPAYAEARYNRGISRLRLGQHEHGWADYEARFYTAGNTERREFNAPEWVGPGDIAGKRILLYAEQGLGDTIQFARYAYDLSAQGAQVTLMAQAALSDLFGPEIQFATQEDHVGAIDLYAPLMSIPHRQGQTASPTGARGAYLSVPASVVQRWANRLGSKSKRRIGVAFAGNPHHQNDALRSIPLSVFSKIFRHTHLEFHLVQKDFRAGDMESLGQFPNVIVHALQIETLADTAAILMAMDMVITVDTSVLHLSGALGLETLGLIAYAPDWRWQLGSSKTHWYPTVSLMRQEHRDDWSPVMRRIDDQLARL
jgi:hypothetical protein